MTFDVDGHSLTAAPVGDEKIFLHLSMAPRGDVRLGDLVDEGLLPEVGAELVLGVAQAGNGLLVIGTARSAARRLAIAVARELADNAALMSIGGVNAEWLLPAPDVPGGVAARARTAVGLGAETLLAPPLSLNEVIMLAREQLPVPVIAAVDVASVAALNAAFATADGAVSVDSVASQVCVVGRSPVGRAVLLEQHAPAVDTVSPSPSRSTSTSSSSRAPVVERAREPDLVSPAPRALPPAGSTSRASRAPPVELPPVPPLTDGPPADWASSEASEDPGWELGDAADGDGVVAYDGRHDDDAPAEPKSAFDNVLSGMKERPTFKPRPPDAHPQTRQLKEEMLPEGDPFGGLTFEPPEGGPEPAEGDDPDGGDR
jgi:hypothetical protein